MLGGCVFFDRSIDVGDAVETESDEFFEFSFSSKVSETVIYGWATDLTSSFFALIFSEHRIIRWARCR